MRLFYILIVSILLASCSDDPKKLPQISPEELQKQLLEANKKAVGVESTQIDAYVERRKLDVKTTKTGLRYVIYHNEEGETVIDNQQVEVNYTVALLDGTECYNTKDEVEQFVVGKDYVESGLHEGIQFMSKGDKAIIIIPSHLAHGLAGDFKKIPLRSTIVYDIELVNFK
jgi:peptidylprolyl isomerase